MTEKTNSPGGQQPVTDIETLKKTYLGYQRKQAGWRELRLLALERLRETLKDPGGIDDPAILKACERLAEAEPTQIEEPFSAFQQAMITRSRNPGGEKEAASITRLANRACDLFQAMAEAANKELDASKAEALTRALIQKAGGRGDDAGLH